LTKILIGTGGWAYFRVSGDPLRTYSSIYDMAEVNSTFYEFPRLSIVQSWRERVPEEFEFAVRCHQNLSHRHRFKPIDQAFKDWDYMMNVCRTLDSSVLIIDTPPNLQMIPEKIKDLKDFFSSADLEGLHLAWDLGTQENEDKRRLVAFLRDRGFIHCIDISVEEPNFQSETGYSRLFGRNKSAAHQFSDEELAEINLKAESVKSEKLYLSYQGIKMYKDAVRMKIYRESGKFPPVTRGKGLESAIEVLREDIKLPTTKTSLIQDQGWKIFDLTEERRDRLQNLLEALPDRPYHNFRELTAELRRLNIHLIFPTAEEKPSK
jgi:uncharacterized protein YecE (DUF72 family)